jgi:carbonic anhydrase
VADEPNHSAEYVRLRGEAERFAEQFDRSDLGPAPLSGLAILTCMDARIVVEDIFGLRAGDANVMRNAGAVASDDFIRSLVLSQRVLGSSEVIVLGHTGCGLHGLAEDELVTQLERESGQRDELAFGAFADLDAHVRRQVARIRGHPWIRQVPVHGMVYDVETGRLRDVV